MISVYLVTFIKLIFDLMSLAIIIRSLFSWIHVNPHDPLIRIIHQITEPVMKIAKKITPNIGMLDISPLIAIFGLEIVKRVLLAILGTT